MTEQSHHVSLSRSGNHFEVAAGQNVLDAAIAAGIGLPYSCRSGTCTSCMATIVRGEHHYPQGAPSALTADDDAAGRALLCQAVPLSNLEIDVAEFEGAQPPRILAARVTGLALLSHDVMQIELTLPAGQQLQHAAGQYVDIILRDGRRRSFSLANSPHRSDSLVLHVRRVPGGHFTSLVFDDLKPKALLRLEAPLGTFCLREDSSRPAIFVAGGTGMAPVHSLLEHAVQIGWPHAKHLFWGVRAKRDIYLDNAPQRWQTQLGIGYTVVLSEPNVADQWQGAQGFVHEQVLAHYPDLSGFDVYLSGPPPLIDAARARFCAAGLPSDRLFFDSFEFSTDP